jgi:hypothetical protein
VSKPGGSPSQQQKEKKMNNEIKLSVDGKTIEFNGVKYHRDRPSQLPMVMTFGGENPLPNAYAGKFVIVRSRNEGINAGTLKAADKTGCILENCRRLWSHRPKDKGLSWYEGVAMSGIAPGHRVSGTVLSKVIVENYSLTLCTEDAAKSIMEEKPNAQS